MAVAGFSEKRRRKTASPWKRSKNRFTRAMVFRSSGLIFKGAAPGLPFVRESVSNAIIPRKAPVDRTEAGGKYLLKGKLYVRIVPLLDGARTMDGIVDALKPDAPPEKAYYALMTLEKKGYIAPPPAPDGRPLAQAAFWHGLDADAKEAAERLAGTSVAVVPIGNTSGDAAALSAALAALEISAAGEGGGEASLAVAVVEDYLQTGLAEMNKRMHEAERPWMPVKAVGQVLWLGGRSSIAAGRKGEAHAGSAWRAASRKTAPKRWSPRVHRRTIRSSPGAPCPQRGRRRPISRRPRSPNGPLSAGTRY